MDQHATTTRSERIDRFRWGVSRLHFAQIVGNIDVAMISQSSELGSQDRALEGVLFYLAAYGIMNVAAFGVLTLLPSPRYTTWR